MAEALIHLTACEQLAQSPHLYPEVASVISREISAAKLGAVFVDLPDYRNNARWSLIFHTHQPTALGIAFAELSQTDVSYMKQPWPLAFVAGYFSHLAVDRVLNSLTQHLVQENLQGGEDAATVRAQCERVQSVLFHQERYGKRIQGTSAITLLAKLAGFDPQKIQFCVKACLKAIAKTPDEKEFAAWHKGFNRKMKQESSSLHNLFRVMPQAGEGLSHKFYRNDFFDFMRYYNCAIELAVDYINSIYVYMKSGDFTHNARQDLYEYIPELDILNPPDEDYIYTVPQGELFAEERKENIVPFSDPRKS